MAAEGWKSEKRKKHDQQGARTGCSLGRKLNCGGGYATIELLYTRI